MSSWQILGSVEPVRLVNARLQLHWAAQVASAPGRQLLEPQHDYSQQSFVWHEGPRALAQGTVPGERPFRSALRLAEPALLLLGESDTVLGELPLAGRTLDEAYGWLEREIEALLGRPLSQPLERPAEMPAHPVETGRHFTAADPGFAELDRYFANADHVLGALAARCSGASAVRCWPHHFDIATLILLDGNEADPEAARSIGAGLSPGDAGRPEPYFYVTPWPSPETSDLPALDGGGSWNTQGWVGAILESSRFAAAGDQERQVESFLLSATAACRRLLGEDHGG